MCLCFFALSRQDWKAVSNRQARRSEGAQGASWASFWLLSNARQGIMGSSVNSNYNAQVILTKKPVYNNPGPAARHV